MTVAVQQEPKTARRKTNGAAASKPVVKPSKTAAPRKKAAPKAPVTAVEQIGPSEAAAMLQHNARNRRLSKAAIEGYADAMRRGEWVLNGESIKFNSAGQLTDGQHRLEAVILSGAKIETFVTRGLPVEAFETIDTGRRRSPGDVLQIHGVKCANNVAATCSALLQCERGEAGLNMFRHRSRPPRGTLVKESLAIQEQTLNLLSELQSKDMRLGRIMSVSHAIALILFCERKKLAKEDIVLDFFKQVATGAYSPERETLTNPAYLLREKMIEAKTRARAVQPLTPGAQFMLASIALYTYLQGKPMKKLEVTAKSTFPFYSL